MEDLRNRSMTDHGRSIRKHRQSEDAVFFTDAVVRSLTPLRRLGLS